MSKQHTHESVTYKSKGRVWEFEAPNYSYRTPIMHGGRTTADKIARIIHGGSTRTKGKGIDGLASANMSTTFHKAAKAASRLRSPIGTFVE